MNHFIEIAGLSEQFSPQFLSTRENIQLVKAKIAALEDELTRENAIISFPDALLAAKQWDEAEAALDFAADVTEDYARTQADCIFKVALAFLEQGWNQRALALTDRAVDICEKIEEPWQKAEALNDLASIYSATGHSPTALELRLLAADIAAKDQDNDLDCSSVMKSITWDLAKTGEFSAAHSVASSIRNPVRKHSAFTYIKQEEKKRSENGLSS